MEKETTAIQDLIAIVEMDYENGVEISMRVFHKMLTDALTKEKEQITLAYHEAFSNCLNEDFTSPSQYFEQTYK